MPIDPARITADLERLAQFSDTTDGNVSRRTFAPAWVEARDFVIEQAKQIGCKSRIDAAGNVHIRQNAISWDASVWICSSHLDTPAGSMKCAGAISVACGLEALRTARADLKVACPLELVIWAESRGQRFGHALVGVRAFAGELSRDQLESLVDSAGTSYLAAGAAHGVNPDKLAEDKLKVTAAVGAVEVAVEPGPVLWNQEIPVAVVRSMSGRRLYRVSLEGLSGAASETPMADRVDALVGASEVICALDRQVLDHGAGSLLTVTGLRCSPDSAEHTVRRAEFNVDLRSPSTTQLASVDHSIQAIIAQIARHRGLSHEITLVESRTAVDMDERVVQKLKRSAASCGLSALHVTVSGASHDAGVIAPLLPTAVLHVASHCDTLSEMTELARIDDLTLATRILLETTRDRRLE